MASKVKSAEPAVKVTKNDCTDCELVGVISGFTIYRHSDPHRQTGYLLAKIDDSNTGETITGSPGSIDLFKEGTRFSITVNSEPDATWAIKESTTHFPNTTRTSNRQP